MVKHISELLPTIEEIKKRREYFAGQKFLCPVCGFDYTHFGYPDGRDYDKNFFFNGRDNWEAWEGRGDAIKFPMWCENNHQWILRMGFHKGQTFIACEVEKKVIDKILPVNLEKDEL